MTVYLDVTVGTWALVQVDGEGTREELTGRITRPDGSWAVVVLPIDRRTEWHPKKKSEAQ